MTKQALRQKIERQQYAHDGREAMSGNLTSKEDGKWKNRKKNSFQDAHLTFPRLKPPCLFSFNLTKKVNWPIDFKGMTS
jgi:hypothetical protein